MEISGVNQFFFVIIHSPNIQSQFGSKSKRCDLGHKESNIFNPLLSVKVNPFPIVVIVDLFSEHNTIDRSSRLGCDWHNRFFLNIVRMNQSIVFFAEI